MKSVFVKIYGETQNYGLIVFYKLTGEIFIPDDEGMHLECTTEAELLSALQLALDNDVSYEDISEKIGWEILNTEILNSNEKKIEKNFGEFNFPYKGFISQ